MSAITGSLEKDDIVCAAFDNRLDLERYKKNEDEVLISSMTKIKPTMRKEISLEVGCCIESSVRNDQLKHVS